MIKDVKIFENVVTIWEQVSNVIKKVLIVNLYIIENI